jgi:SAM-dependent methyltransferase
LVGGALRRTMRELIPFYAKAFSTSRTYWLKRYAFGGNSGSGSRGSSAVYKAGFVNGFVAAHGIASVGDLGCGDGAVAELITAPQYTGYDISARALALAAERQAGEGKQFALLGGGIKGADLMLSMDVVYHLIEDKVFDRHLTVLAAHAGRFVLIYGTDHEAAGSAPHVRHRRVSERFLALNAGGWELLCRQPNPLYGRDWRTHPHFDGFHKPRRGLGRTLELVGDAAKDLEAAGVSAEQAEAHARALKKAIEAGLAASRWRHGSRQVCLRSPSATKQSCR